MCGRYALNHRPADLIRIFELVGCPEFGPRYNIAPTADVPVIRLSPEGERVAHLLRWGLVPHWAKNPSIGARLNNARGETVAGKPSFRDAFRRRRCIVPATGFYEWKAEGRLKLPHYMSAADGAPLALGGLWESWKAPDGTLLRTCCIVTTGPNAVMAPIHDRMPVILGAGEWRTWLESPPDEALALVRPCAPEMLRAWPVSRRVSRAAEEGEDLILPLAEGGTP
ncbi:MAG: SOS response-associated peptidase [Rhodocyclaceae bacterium]|nr:SOS response-associated peptidase [Rhodocyclaceae bacterium]